MKIGARWWAPLVLSIGCGNAMALLAIEGTVVIEPSPATLLRGQTATLTYTFTNTGDEPVEIAASGVEYYESGPLSTVLPVPTAATPPCFSQFVDFPSPIPGMPTYVVNTNTFFPRPILPGESRQCVMNLFVSPDAVGPFVQQFGFMGSRGAQVVNTALFIEFNLGVGAVTVPALTWSGIALLALIIALLGIGLLRRQSYTRRMDAYE